MLAAEGNRSKTKKNDVLENLNGQRWGIAIKQMKIASKQLAMHARKKNEQANFLGHRRRLSGNQGLRPNTEWWPRGCGNRLPT
jgi:hypothetical protein